MRKVSEQLGISTGTARNTAGARLCCQSLLLFLLVVSLAILSCAPELENWIEQPLEVSLTVLDSNSKPLPLIEIRVLYPRDTDPDRESTIGKVDTWPTSEYVVATTTDVGEVKLQFPGKMVSFWQGVFGDQDTSSTRARLWILPEGSSLIILDVSESSQTWTPVIRVGLDPVGPTVDKTRSTASLNCADGTCILEAVLQLTPASVQ